MPATQFHDFAEVLATVATAEPQGRHVDVAGPGPEYLVDMARRSYAARGRPIQLVPSWHTGILADEMAGDVLLPSANAHITPTSFGTWLAQLSPTVISRETLQEHA